MTGQDRSWAPATRPPDEIAAGPVVLRRWQLDDVAPLEREIERSRGHLAEWLEWAGRTDHDSLAVFLLGSEAAFQARTDFGYGIFEVGGEIAGGAGLHARLGKAALEIGYWVGVDRINRGYATAAAEALTRAALALGDVGRVEIHCDEANVRSAAVPRKLGYRLDRVENDDLDAPGDTGRSMVWIFP
jgi:RimJ/RimL family protein N-acetyltransferase